MLAANLGAEAAVVAADGHEALARDVAAHHQRVGLVHLSGREELAEATVGAVDVGREIDAEGPLLVSHRPWPRLLFDYSGGSSRMARPMSMDEDCSLRCRTMK